MVNLGEIELAPDVVWVGIPAGMLCGSAAQVEARRGYPNRAAARSAFEALS